MFKMEKQDCTNCFIWIKYIKKDKIMSLHTVTTFGKLAKRQQFNTAAKTHT